MGRAVLSSSSTRRWLTAAAVLLTAACARSAPELPPQSNGGQVTLTPVEAAMQCSDIDAAITARRGEREALTATIHGNRQRNQTAGYFGALFILPLVATEGNEAEKRRLDEIQAETDRLFAVRRARSC